ncbi:hypothetical protein [Leifsonia shinshuensis]|uniref:hypothetical protein n=1 Tax=Leifsonia shinshuensis TaxID=150026 RepID=UPI002859C733|nr:hypothetical protein [Leifsonia shinshuensis]MDR6970599.1 hypothetical protein [Leifsonia shinshuensis]
MPWWSWLVIWTVLVLGLLGELAYFAWSLFRKVVAAGREAAALMDKAEVLSQRAEELHDSFEPAVLADVDVLRAEREQHLTERAYARQARRDARVRRGRLLVDVDPATVPDRFAHLLRRT